MKSRFWPLVWLLLLGLLFFHDLVLHPTQVLYSNHSDFLAEHIPAKRFLVRSFQETGELPLWNPHHFAGSPFVHDIQVAMFYPPHLLLLVLPEEAVGPALSWLVVLHVVLAGWLMYAYACHRGLPMLPAFIAGMGFMFGGRWLMHLLAGGHYILIGMCWLPLVLLCWERVIERGRWAWGILAAFAYALMILSNQPQWTFYSGLFAALWTFGAVLEQEQRRLAIGRWLGTGAMIVVLSVGMTAIQLLPTLEAAGQSGRASGVGTEGILSEGLLVLLFLVGPPMTNEPFNLAWEARGGLGILWLIAAIWAPLLWKERRLRYEAWVCLGLFLFAMGGAILFQWLPGFRFFRQPARMVVVATLPIAWLVAKSMQAIMVEGGLSAEQKAACQRWLIRVVVAIAILGGGFMLRRQVLEAKELLFTLYIPLSGAIALCMWLSIRRSRPAIIFLILLMIDAIGVVIGLGQSASQSRVFAIPRTVQIVADRRTEYGRVLDFDIMWRNSPITPLSSGAPLAMISGIDSLRGYSPLDVLRYREYLSMIENRDDSSRALTSKFSYPVIGSVEIKNSNLVDLLGVRYFLRCYYYPYPEYGNEFVYDFLSGGWVGVGTFTIEENKAAFSRTSVVPNAKPCPPRSSVLETFRNTNFRDTVYLEEFDEEPNQVERSRKRQESAIRTYTPNEIRIDTDGDAPGYLVLTDVWFPGWVCTIDGESTKVYRANYTFRGVQLPAGQHEVVFRFEPTSYHRGRKVSFVTLALTAGLGLILLVRRW